MIIKDHMDRIIYQSKKKVAGNNNEFNEDVTIVLEEGDVDIKLTTPEHYGRTCNYLTYDGSGIHGIGYEYILPKRTYK